MVILILTRFDPGGRPTGFFGGVIVDLIQRGWNPLGFGLGDCGKRGPFAGLSGCGLLIAGLTCCAEINEALGEVR